MKKILIIIILQSAFVNAIRSQDIAVPLLKSNAHLKVSQNLLLSNPAAAASSYENVIIEAPGNEVRVTNTTINLKNASITCDRLIIGGAASTALNLDKVTINCETLVFTGNIASLSIRNKVNITCRSLELQSSAVGANININNTGNGVAVGNLVIKYDVLVHNGRTFTINDPGGVKVTIGRDQ